MIVTLAGGVGAARFLEGVVQVVAPADVTAIVNTGDDITLHGLYISPDVDIVTYTLAGIVDEAQGWGMRGDTYNTLEMLRRLGADTWFLLGDRDLATHIRRTELLLAGATLSTVTDEFRRSLGVDVRILPMSDDPVGTYIRTPDGLIHFENYLVQRHAQDQVLGIHFEGTAETSAPVVAVSPIVGGAAIKGPAAPLMTALGYEVSARGVAACYAGLADVLVIDQVDEALAGDIRAAGMDVLITDTIMRGPAEKRALARAALDAARRKGARR